MPMVPPPGPDITVSPHLMLLNVGTQLWRVHLAHHSPTEFNCNFSDDVFGGGRFDGTNGDKYPWLYFASDRETAVLETLTRNMPYNQQGMRLVLRQSIAKQCISALRLTRAVTLISLMDAEDLAVVRQDEWLVQADAFEYPQTRRWGSWLREQCPAAQGIVWPSRRNIGHKAIVLFGDRCDRNLLVPVSGSEIELDSTAGALWFNRTLSPLCVRVRPPSHHQSPP